ncbi:hypothetical protein C8A00DRAFT_32651 [Chaetomidium leptoderma]|uniref:Uncharacterized protein n=1 Tax=Chaetomidium leptoderma TaxID=669021 RepID=A0AAN6VNH8_9PEZI|nr:hypothetical protein C8A00DRAFT_32651 [Chaetomidium leptoderma]
MTDGHEVAAKARRRLATPELTQWVKTIKDEQGGLPSRGSNYDPRGGSPRGHVLHLRLSRREREMLEVAASNEDDHFSPPVVSAGLRELVQEVVVLLFFRWSFAQHALREMLHQLGELEDRAESEDGTSSENGSRGEPGEASDWESSDSSSDTGSGNSQVDGQLRGKLLVKSFAVGLATRHDHFLPWDRRKERVKELLADPCNEKFWDTFQTRYRAMAKALDDNRPGDFAVAPHPDDAKIWFYAAYQVIQNYQVMRKWPGVHEAATLAAEGLGIDNSDPEYPYLGTWFRDFLAASTQGKPHRGRPNAYCRWLRSEFTAATSPDADGLIDGLEELRLSSEYPQYEEEWVETLRASVDAADVWDVWTLVRMLQCESASHQIPDSEYEVVRTALSQGTRDLTIACPLSIIDPKDFVALASYSSSGSQFHPVTDESIVAELLDSIGLEDTGDWDLVSLQHTEKNHPWPFADHFSNYNHYRHVLYLTEDVNTRYLANNCDLPSQTVPCRCKGYSGPTQPDQDEEEVEFGTHVYHNAHCRSHHGGDVVFARRKLEDTLFAQNLDRYWVDWNDCMLILGRGYDENGNLIDGETVYILETLPGDKARALKQEALDEARGLASACLFFNLKLQHRHEADMSRSFLRTIMGSRYQTRFGDFTYAIDCGEFDFDKAEELMSFSTYSSYGLTYLVPWKKARRYDQHGDVSYENGRAVIKVLAASKDEPSSQRLDMFCHRIAAFYDKIAGNRVKNAINFFGCTSVPLWSMALHDNHVSVRRPPAGFESSRQRAWAFVFEEAINQPLEDWVPELLQNRVERESWFTLLSFLLEIGTALRDMHKLSGPYGGISNNSILLRLRLRPRGPLSLDNNEFTAPPEPSHPPSLFPPPPPQRMALEDAHNQAPININQIYQAVLAEPKDAPSRAYRSPELLRALGGGGPRNDAANTPITRSPGEDAHDFASYAVHLINRSRQGFFTGLAGLGAGAEGTRVVYVEVLAALEAVLAAEAPLVGGEEEEEDREEEEEGSGHDDRVQAMDDFLAVARTVASGEVVLNGRYPVPEASSWYDFATAFPLLTLKIEANDFEGWFQREKILLYWINRPQGWIWNDDAPSSGSENEDQEGEVVWDWSDGDSDSLKSGITE